MTLTLIAIAIALVSGTCIGIVVTALCAASRENDTINDLIGKIQSLTADKERLLCMLGETER